MSAKIALAGFWMDVDGLVGVNVLIEAAAFAVAGIGRAVSVGAGVAVATGVSVGMAGSIGVGVLVDVKGA